MHASAETFEAAGWTQLVGLYEELIRLQPSPVVVLNRTVPLSCRDGRGAAQGPPHRLDRHPYLPAGRADLLRRLGRHTDAAVASQHPAALTADPAGLICCTEQHALAQLST